MSQFWRVSAVTSVGLFLEACAFYFAISVAAAAIHLTEARLPIWLVFIALLSSYFLSIWVQSLPYTRGIRGMIGLAVSLVFLLILSYLHTGPGLGSLNELIDGDARTAVALTISLLFMICLWWRGATIAYEEVSLESLRGSFRWGLVALFVAVVADVDDVVALVAHPAHLVMHLGDQRTYRIDENSGPVIGGVDHVRCRAVGRQHDRPAGRHVGDVVDEDDSGPFETGHHCSVVNDLVVAVHRRFEDLHHPGQSLDRHPNTGTEPSGLS